MRWWFGFEGDWENTDVLPLRGRNEGQKFNARDKRHSQALMPHQSSWGANGRLSVHPDPITENIAEKRRRAVRLAIALRSMKRAAYFLLSLAVVTVQEVALSQARKDRVSSSYPATNQVRWFGVSAVGKWRDICQGGVR
jgi:hypothetical protein